MMRLLVCLVVFTFVSTALAVSEDKNWGDKQTRDGKQSDKLMTKPKPKLRDVHEKEGKIPLEKEKIGPMK